jgi:FkbM family methyltransferase
MEKLQGIFWYGDFDNYFLGHQFEEIFKARIYAPYLENVKDAVVIDVGGNIGAFSLYASKYAKQVYTIEPSLLHFTTIMEMIKFNKIENIKPIRKALFIDSDKTYDFFHNPNRTMYSLHQAISDGTPPEKVQSISLDKLFKDEKITHCDLLKMDVEGTEVEIISSAGFAKVADKIDVVIGETHSWSGRNPNQIIDAFKQNGFIVETIPGDASLFVAKKPQSVGTKV